MDKDPTLEAKRPEKTDDHEALQTPCVATIKKLITETLELITGTLEKRRTLANALGGRLIKEALAAVNYAHQKATPFPLLTRIQELGERMGTKAITVINGPDAEEKAQIEEGLMAIIHKRLNGLDKISELTSSDLSPITLRAIGVAEFTKKKSEKEDITVKDCLKDYRFLSAMAEVLCDFFKERGITCRKEIMVNLIIEAVETDAISG